MKQTVPCLTAEGRPATDFKNKPEKKQVKSVKKSSASSLLRYAGTWRGDDIEQCLEELYLVRGEAKF
jgi:hypothetical protein